VLAWPAAALVLAVPRLRAARSRRWCNRRQVSSAHHGLKRRFQSDGSRNRPPPNVVSHVAANEMIMSLDRQAYLSLRRQYEPDVVKLAIIAESPPTSGKYFYNPAGSKSEPLFAALMKQLPLSPSSKEMGLREFQQRGWILVDATYEPVNAFGSSKRDEVIERDYPLLRADLSSLIPDKSTPVVLIKTNVCRLLEPKLKQDGFNVLNRGRVIYFPAAGQQNEFQRQFKAILAMLVLVVLQSD
jgi:hypothetical protein